jgi:hypothetical protein
MVTSATTFVKNIQTELKKVDKTEAKNFLLGLRNEIDALLSKFGDGGSTIETYNITENESASSVNPTLFARGGGVDSNKIKEHVLECKKLVSAFCKEYGQRFSLNEKEILSKVSKNITDNGADIFIAFDVNSNIKSLKIDEVKPRTAYLVLSSQINPNGVSETIGIKRTYTINFKVKGDKRYTQRRTEEGYYFKSYNYGLTIDEVMDKFDTDVIYELFPLEQKDNFKLTMSNVFANGGSVDDGDFARGGGVDKLPSKLQNRLNIANSILQNSFGRKLTTKEAIRWNIDNNSQSGFNAGQKAIYLVDGDESQFYDSYYNIIGDALIDISEKMTGVTYDLSDTEIEKYLQGKGDKQTKTQKETALKYSQNNKFADGGEVGEFANGGEVKEKIVKRFADYYEDENGNHVVSLTKEEDGSGYYFLDTTNGFTGGVFKEKSRTKDALERYVRRNYIVVRKFADGGSVDDGDFEDGGSVDDGDFARGGGLGERNVDGLQTEIHQLKRKLVAQAKLKGISENFGQKEVRMLEDKYPMNFSVGQFDEWVQNFDLNSYKKGGVTGKDNRAKKVVRNVNGFRKEFPIGDAWRKEHNQYDKSQKYEIPTSSRKS